MLPAEKRSTAKNGASGAKTALQTSRLTTAENAAHGWYSANEFVMCDLPNEVLRRAVELGRACIHKDHRSPAVLYLLWAGIASYMATLDKRYLFGCCSLTSQDARQGKHVMELL